MGELLAPGSEYDRYARDPEGFVREELRVKILTDGQLEILAALHSGAQTIIVKSATAVGKTHILSCIGLYFYKVYEHVQVYTAAAQPESNLRNLLWGEIGGHTVDRSELFFDDTVSLANMKIGRSHPRQFIVGTTIPVSANDNQVETRFSGKHQEVLVFLIDEADGVPDAVYKGIDGCASGGMTLTILCYNPKEKRGEPYRMIAEGRAKVITLSAFDHPNVITGKNIITGAVTREKTAQRVNEWCEYAGFDDDVNCFELPDFMVGAVGVDGKGFEYPPLREGFYRVSTNDFWYKVLGEYPPAGANKLIPDQFIDDAIARWEMYVAAHNGKFVPPEGIRPTMTIDVSSYGDDSSCFIYSYGFLVDMPEEIAYADPDLVANKGAVRYKERNCSHARADVIGVGAGVPERMCRMSDELQFYIDAAPVVVSEKSVGWTEDGDFYQLRDEAYWELRKAFMNGEIAIPPYSRLVEPLRILTYDIKGTSIRVIQKKDMIRILGYSPDPLEALMIKYAPARTWMGGI